MAERSWDDVKRELSHLIRKNDVPSVKVCQWFEELAASESHVPDKVRMHGVHQGVDHGIILSWIRNSFSYHVVITDEGVCKMTSQKYECIKDYIIDS